MLVIRHLIRAELATRCKQVGADDLSLARQRPAFYYEQQGSLERVFNSV